MNNTQFRGPTDLLTQKASQLIQPFIHGQCHILTIPNIVLCHSSPPPAKIATYLLKTTHRSSQSFFQNTCYQQID